MKAYKVEMIVVDFDGYGGDVLRQNIEDMRYYAPSITKIVEGDIGEWSDDHPLNLRSTSYE
jgi:hypothetical protein